MKVTGTLSSTQIAAPPSQPFLMQPPRTNGAPYLLSHQMPHLVFLPCFPHFQWLFFPQQNTRFAQRSSFISDVQRRMRCPRRSLTYTTSSASGWNSLFWWERPVDISGAEILIVAYWAVWGTVVKVGFRCWIWEIEYVLTALEMRLVTENWVKLKRTHSADLYPTAPAFWFEILASFQSQVLCF